MHSLIESMNNPAVAAALVLAIYVYIRVTAAWIFGLSSRYAARAADQFKTRDD
ncbi:hypothetical protein LTS63_15765 [Mycobacterium intracellulare]|uniref:hypothetical protein n=1 Tax=Mycobacterium intracellulare TaxID=1767 RepID=UPI001E47451C|nr:hypothetical protein [Mycobacterium intracellulare]UGU00425.1 hypothetical protein LTS63_15765 [Mycobacterium intracellulare]